MLNKLRLDKINMNLDSIHRLIEDTQIFQMQQSSMKSPCGAVVSASPPRDTHNSSLSRYGPQSHAAPHFWAPSYNVNEWDICEELRLWELKEVKARAAQMEKTMRWWSDCTANWREKWSRVRAERNRAREEGRQLRIQLEMTVKELSALKKRQSLPREKEALDVNMTQDPKLPSFSEAPHGHKDQFQICLQTCEPTRECMVKTQFPIKASTNAKEEDVIIDPVRLNEDLKLSLDCPDLFKNSDSENIATERGLGLRAINVPLENEVPEISTFQRHLNEFQKVLWKEREMRASLEKEIEQLESALSVWKWKYEELKESKVKNLKEFNILQGQHENEVERISRDIKEGEKSRNSKDRVIYELRAEELLELQHAYHKLNKQYQERMAELTHANNLMDQNEAEVKKLRFRVEELKRGLNQKEEELDDSLNQIRKLQRSLDEQKETNENMETKLRHLKSRRE
ncbi:coiled-coil domain-containing protein 102B isoform X4 [Tamandua tetradactyla]|uniref:coiled-coil domain-containing protein 102B isoform X4 n=1 Tax=Tamandua tetradactyla TaxID=48850 RepID=UPI0040548514